MLKWLKDRRKNQRIRDEFYGRIVALSRHPLPYAEWGVPDTLEGRFEMLTLCMFLVLERLRRAGPQGAQTAQGLTDTFFADMDAAHRQLGVGDLKVPRRMRQLADAFGARLQAYRQALESGGPGEFAAAITRHFSEHAGDTKVQSMQITDCAISLLRELEACPPETLLADAGGILSCNRQ
ncbi:MAG: ubiquinol-cytochrome C chaperone family protein [Pseudomonadota bacterium]|nr:ubiquinol-cytochrome C chaperone family protein [Pseudomonadota bacterium]